MKGIILAGGKGTRLYPLTKVLSKHLLPIYNKPLIYYPLSTLMLANIREILIICNPEHLTLYKSLLGNGQEYGLNLKYEVQLKPNGVGEAFHIGKDFIGDDDVCLILGDNIFYGPGLTDKLNTRPEWLTTAIVYGYQVSDASRFGVAEIDSAGKVLSIEEKPKIPKSNYAITGLYFFPNNVLEIISKVSPSDRGELEITDVNKVYLSKSELDLKLLGRGFSWFDVGTHKSFLKASNFVQTIEEMQGYKIADLKEISISKGWIA